MSYTGFRPVHATASTTRPAEVPQAIPGRTWAKQGTRYTHVDFNRLIANLEEVVAGLGGDLNDGDLQLLNAVKGYVDSQLTTRLASVVGNASADSDTLGELEGRINAIVVTQGSAI
jgi:hypothetical protein